MGCSNGTCFNVGCGHGSSSSSCSCGSNCSNACSSCAGSGSTGGGGDGGGCSCGGNCSTGCTGTCKGSCSTACDTGCTSREAIDLYEKLKNGLNKKILAADLSNINAMIQSEAKRRNKTTTSQSFSVKDKATSTKIKALQSNLSTIGFKTSKDAGQKIKSFKATGQELIDKALDAYETEIKHS